MDYAHPVEADSDVFTGTVRVWRGDYGELFTDSGVTVPLLTRGLPPIAVGTRLTVIARKFKPLYQIQKVSYGE
jgi:ribosomal protein L35AE/L33A